MIQRVQRFLSKFAMDVVRTMVASAIGALLFTHQWTLGSAPVTQPVAASVGTPGQVGQMVRDEHDVMVQYLKAEHAKERAALEKEVRDAQAARSVQDAQRAQEAMRPTDAEPRKTAALPRPVPAPRLASETAPANVAPVVANAAPIAPVAAPVAVAGANPAGSAVVANLPPPITITPLPDVVASAPKVEVQQPPQPQEPTLAQKAAAATHVNDVVSFMRDVSSWFTHEDAPVPPADVRLNRFISASM